MAGSSSIESLNCSGRGGMKPCERCTAHGRQYCREAPLLHLYIELVMLLNLLIQENRLIFCPTKNLNIFTPILIKIM